MSLLILKSLQRYEIFLKARVLNYCKAYTYALQSKYS